MKKLPKIVHFRITSFCNNKCIHCFGNETKPCDLSYLEIKKIIQVIKNGGAEAIHLTGGEPTLRKDFNKIIKFIKTNGIKIILDTNGDFFQKHKKIITNSISVLGLPIDFSNNSFRNPKNLKNVLNILKFYKNYKGKKPKIRILTAITKKNRDELSQIGEILRDYKIDVWRIYQFLPLKGTRAFQNRKKLTINKNVFDNVTKKLQNKFKNIKIHLVPLGHRNRAYFIIYPLGEVKISIEKPNYENKSIGSIFDKNIIDKWHRYSSQKNFQKNAKEIFDLIKK